MLPGILVDDIEARTQGMAMLKLEDFVISSYDARGPSIGKSNGNLEIFCDYDLKNRVARKYLWGKICENRGLKLEDFSISSYDARGKFFVLVEGKLKIF